MSKIDAKSSIFCGLRNLHWSSADDTSQEGPALAASAAAEATAAAASAAEVEEEGVGEVEGDDADQEEEDNKMKNFALHHFRIAVSLKIFFFQVSQRI